MHLPFIHSCLSSPLASGAFIFILCPLSPSWIYWITQRISSQQPPYQDIFNSVAENRKQWLAGCFSVVTFGLQIKRLLQQQLIWSSPWKYKTLRTYSCYFWLKMVNISLSDQRSYKINQLRAFCDEQEHTLPFQISCIITFLLFAGLLKCLLISQCAVNCNEANKTVLCLIKMYNFHTYNHCMPIL